MKRLVMLIMILVVLSGCAALTKVPTATTKGTVNDVCDVLDRCEANGKIVSSPSACDVDLPGSLINEFNESKYVSGSRMTVDVDAMCVQLAACLDESPELRGYEGRSYSRWCGLLQGLAATGK